MPGGDRATVAWNLIALGGAIRTQGRYAEALEATGRAVDVAFHPPDHQARMRGPNMLHGMVLCDADRLEEAAATLRTAAEECAAVESWNLLADIQLLASEVRLLRGEWDEAVPEIEGGIEFARERGNLITLPRFHAHLAIAAAARGDAAAGEAALGPFAGELTSESPAYGAEYVFHAAAFVAEVAGNRRRRSSTCVAAGSTTPCVITTTDRGRRPRGDARRPGQLPGPVRRLVPRPARFTASTLRTACHHRSRSSPFEAHTTAA